MRHTTIFPGFHGFPHSCRTLTLVILGAILLMAGSLLAHYSSVGQAQNKRLQFEQDMQKVFSAHEDLRMDPLEAVRQVKTTGRLSISTLSHHFELNLQPNDMRAADYEAEEVVNGELREVPRLESRTYRGTVAGMPGTDARFTIDGTRVEGMIVSLDDIYFVEPAGKYSTAANSSDFLLYRASDVRPEIERTCVDTLVDKVTFQSRQLAAKAAENVEPKVFSPLKVVEIATEADNEYTALLGGTTAANNEILSILNQVDAIYQRDIGLTFTVVFQHTWPEGSDPYSANNDPRAMLDEFTNYWNANIPNPRDVARMWTGRDLGGPSGIAWQGVVCVTGAPAYGISERETLSPFRVGIPAHEIGHNFNAGHSDGQAGCDNTIMVATQTQSNNLTFCTFSVNEITNYVNANSSCLSSPISSTIQFSSNTFPVNEGGGAGTITVTRTTTSAAATVDVATSDSAGLQACTVANGRASERCDYTTSVGTVRFAAGESSKTFTIPLIDDVWVEGAETFSVTLRNPTGGTLGNPSGATVQIIENDTVQPTSNPINGVEFFVRQQYLDILGRQPDQGGFNNWVNTLRPCPNGGFGEPPASNCDRLHVAAGFFQSAEFLNRGYFAFRFYMVAFNQRPLYSQFIPDMALVGGPKTAAEEEAAKVAFADAFVQRPEFLARYGAQSGQTLANSLLQTAGLPPGSYNAGSQTNGQILRGIAESSAALNKFLTEGTVSILYFGFTRRDPDTQGYQNNVNTLNANPNNLRHMIFIFIYSSEYLIRFGPP